MENSNDMTEHCESGGEQQEITAVDGKSAQRIDDGIKSLVEKATTEETNEERRINASEDTSFKISRYLNNKMEQHRVQPSRPQRVRKKPDFLQYH